MKKILLSLTLVFSMSSCIVIKVYDTPKAEDAQPKVIASKRMMLPSDRHIPLPNGDKEILFFGEGFPPAPEVFHFKVEDSLVDQLLGDSIQHKGVFMIKLDNMDSLPEGMNFQWKSKQAMHHTNGLKMMKKCCMDSAKTCELMDSIPSSITQLASDKKSIRIIKIDQKDQAEKNTFVIKTKGGENKTAPLIIIDGDEKSSDFDLQSISPDQIERIDVLKDESAIKKVGKEKGANGVILITMKKQ